MRHVKMATCLWFDHGKAREAAEFYASVFPDSSVEKGFIAPSDFPDGKKGDELTVEFTVDLEAEGFVRLEHRPAVEPEEGCKDRWGFSWQITPRADGRLARSRPRRRQARHGRDDDHAEDRRREDRSRARRAHLSRAPFRARSQAGAQRALR